MSEDVESGKVYCKFCGFEIKKDAQFCKNCGKGFNEEYNFISRINGKINILSVFIGLIVSVIVLLIGASFFGVIITAKIMDVTLYLFLLLFVMIFLGGLTTGITGSRNINEGLINGSILSLVAFIILGFIFGTYLLVIVGITSAIASAFSSFGSASASNVSSPSITGDNLFILMKGILIIITCFFAGTGGGALGAWIKGGIK